MVRILHTADWQMGLRAQHVASVAKEVRRARLDAARNVIRVANSQRVDAVVLAGDIFEDNLVDDLLVREVMTVLEASRAPVFVLPGNHDALTPEAVYHRASWKQRPAQVHMLDGEAPVPVPGTSAVLLAAPLRQKKGMKDPTAPWWGRQDVDAIRVGVAHGSLRIAGRHAPDDFPIALDAVARAGLDYLALGHWHGQYIHEGRAAYAGAHETTKFGEEGSGQALLVELASRGAMPRLTPVSTGTLSWRAVELDLGQGAESEAKRVLGELRDSAERAKTLVRVRTTGVASEDADAVVKGLEDDLLGKGFLHVRVERHDKAKAEVEGRLAEIARGSSLVAALLGEQSGALEPGVSEAGRLAARRLLSELVMEAWR
ncbi:DNA repair exonuclease [Myxococcus sp. K15C18031901]|uniref:metallophosphoesterase family protein n=1 Tax=Myxococcus dinghuensis TaxID=2906761 RepID=UPI0020A70DE5|nr:DNA repair exonuclease [Myxococcus dinghuensis]MCP3098434.1 DNA repair exonuclease [Myxococcus dinghuensis]